MPLYVEAGNHEKNKLNVSVSFWKMQSNSFGGRYFLVHLGSLDGKTAIVSNQMRAAVCGAYEEMAVQLGNQARISRKSKEGVCD